MERSGDPISERIEELKTDLLKSMSYEKILQKHIIDRPSAFFDEILNRRDSEYELRANFAESFSININDVVIVGSAKIGFSVKTHEFTKFDASVDSFGKAKKSDIDIAVINRELFDNLSYELYAMSRHFDEDWILENWNENRFYDGNSGKDLFKMYTFYLAKGWMRPDFMPELFLQSWDAIKVSGRWRTLLSKRKVSFGLYSSWRFFKHYHMDNFGVLKAKLELGLKNVK